jgi:Homeodomain-like domain
MASAVELRNDFSATDLRRLAAASKDANQSRRLLSLAAVRDGMNRTEAAKIGGMDRQTLRDWVHRFKARSARSCDFGQFEERRLNAGFYQDRSSPPTS